MAYENMNKIYRENTEVFAMAVANLLDIGFRTINEVTDEDIETLEGNGLMTKEFVQTLMRVSREIAKECGNNVIEIIQFCQVENIFDTKWYTGLDDDEEI